MRDRIITIRHNPGCGGVAYWSISRETDGMVRGVGHVTVGAPPDHGELIRCGSCDEVVAGAIVNGQPQGVPFTPYAEQAP